MFGADVIVLQLAGFGLRRIENFFEAGAEKEVAGAGALDFVASGKFAFEIGLQLAGGHAEFLEQIRNETVRLADQCQQQMYAVHFLMRKALGDALRLLQGLL